MIKQKICKKITTKMSIIDWTKIPDLEIKHLNRSYIDSRRQSTYSVMKGEDDESRNFVVVKFKIGETHIFETFFQRYHRNTYPGITVWESMRKIFDVAIRKEQFQFIEKVIDGQEVVCPDNIGIKEEFVGMKIELN